MKNLNIVIEIPKNSQIKYEYDRFNDCIVVDRILRGNNKYPANYGYIPKTLDWDGDELDVLIYSDFEFHPGVIVNVRIVGAMKMNDDGETDTKLIAVHTNDHRHDKIHNINDLPQQFLDEINKFFLTYKKHRGDIVKITGFENVQWAENEYYECIELYKKYSKMPHAEFLKKMKKEHPEKY